MLQKLSTTVGNSLFLSALVLASLGVSSTWAATVVGQGAGKVQRKPQLVRLHLEIVSQGKDLGDAFAQLEQRRVAVQKRLLGLTPSTSLAQVAAPRLITHRFGVQPPADPQPIGLALEPSPALGPTAATPTDLQVAPGPAHSAPVELTSVLLRRSSAAPAVEPVAIAPIAAQVIEVDFPVAAATTAECLVLSTNLRERVKTADLAGLRELPHGLGCSSCGTAPGECRVAFVHRITPEDQTEVLSQAFSKARRAASDLAQAAGGRLGPICKLEETTPSAPPPPPLPGGFGFPVAQSGSSPSELIAEHPDQLLLERSVTATFELLEPGAAPAVGADE